MRATKKVRETPAVRIGILVLYSLSAREKAGLVFVEENNVIHPLEIKKSAAPDRREVKKYSVIDKSSKQFQTV